MSFEAKSLITVASFVPFMEDELRYAWYIHLRECTHDGMFRRAKLSEKSR
jgi:hypothetical protein